MFAAETYIQTTMLLLEGAARDARRGPALSAGTLWSPIRQMFRRTSAGVA